MKRILILSAMLVFVATGASAGEGKGCEASTQECLDYMANKMQNSGWVGVELEGIENAPGNLVVGVVDGSPAEAAGLQKGDILMAINGIEMIDENMEEISKAWKAMTPGAEVVWTMKRGDKEKKHNIQLAAMPADILAKYVGSHMLEHAGVELASADEHGDQ